MQKRLIGLRSEDIVHTKDKSTLNTLNKVPGLQKVIQVLVADNMEKMATIEYSGNGFNINGSSSPVLFTALKEACRTLDIKETPSFSTEWSYAVNSFTVGNQHKRVVLLSGAADLLTDNEIQFIIGHELGHIKCNHMIYIMLTESLYAPIISSSAGNLILSAIKMPLINWYRVADFTADRAGLLCCQDINVVFSTMIKMAGLPKKYHEQIDIQSFIQQARDFKTLYSSNMDKAMKMIANFGSFHPWLVLRASELLDWYESGEYNTILRKYGSNIKFQ